jgi:4-carboxymuconolactone decarboxylase
VLAHYRECHPAAIERVHGRDESLCRVRRPRWGAAAETAVLDRDSNGNLVRKAGIMAIVLASGEVRPGDPIEITLPPLPHRPPKWSKLHAAQNAQRKTGETTMPRLTPLDLNTLTGEQKRVADGIVSGPRGGLRGPFEAWLRSPALAERAQLLGEYCRFQSVLPPAQRELAILLAGEHWKAQFEFWAHARLGRDAGLDPEIIEAIRTGNPPVFSGEAEQLIYDFVTEYFATNRVSETNLRPSRSPTQRTGRRRPDRRGRLLRPRLHDS